MANRTMAAKALKLKKQKRLFPKQYQANYIPIGRGPNQEVMSGYKERARGLAFDDKFLNFLEMHARFKNKPPGKVEAEAAIKRILDIVPQDMSFTLIRNAFQWARIFFNSEKNCFILLHENYKEGRVRTSMTYHSKDNIVRAWNTDRIRWVEVKTITNGSSMKSTAGASAPPPRGS